ncbi:MAG: hypothetical protein M1818_005110 [Claussenomyces sp. TS43310]|nr:MAG: hypothetical protein M1818_005110 [Claussenomyces sp. TS43310]
MVDVMDAAQAGAGHVKNNTGRDRTEKVDRWQLSLENHPKNPRLRDDLVPPVKRQQLLEIPEMIFGDEK